MAPIITRTRSKTAVTICAVVSLTTLGQTTPSQPGAEREALKLAASQPAKPSVAPPATRTPAPASADPAVRTPPQVSPEDLLKEFQKDRPRAVPIPPSGSPDEEVVESTAPASTGGGRRLPDGFFVVDRVGRVTRDGEWWIFVFEGYNDTHPEPPMKLLPNRLLERMVIESEGATSSAVFVVSGEVTEFKSENYLLLRKLLLRRNLGNLEK